MEYGSGRYIDGPWAGIATYSKRILPVDPVIVGGELVGEYVQSGKKKGVIQYRYKEKERVKQGCRRDLQIKSS